jgi:hypothetical protein
LTVPQLATVQSRTKRPAWVGSPVVIAPCTGGVVGVAVGVLVGVPTGVLVAVPLTGVGVRVGVRVAVGGVPVAVGT